MEKCLKGTIGKPLFKRGDTVGFYVKLHSENKEIFCEGKICTVDAYGTFEQNNEPSYDVMVENFYNKGKSCMVKHIAESRCYKL